MTFFENHILKFYMIRSWRVYTPGERVSVIDEMIAKFIIRPTNESASLQ
jgi:hypothetical protein